MSILDLIDLSNQTPQYFSFPNPLIKYIFDFSQLILSQKFIKCCKYFKLLHLRKNESQVDTLAIYAQSCTVAAGLSEKRVEHIQFCFCKWELKTEMKTIKVFNTFACWSKHSNCFIPLLQKLDLCQTKKLTIYVRIVLERNILEKILHPSLEELLLYCNPYKIVNPALIAFQRCPKLEKVEIGFYDVGPKTPLINKDIFKEIAQTKRKKKIKDVYFQNVMQINQKDIFNFLGNRMASKSTVELMAPDMHALNNLNRIFKRIKKQKKPKDWVSIITRLAKSADHRNTFYFPLGGNSF